MQEFSKNTKYDNNPSQSSLVTPEECVAVSVSCPLLAFPLFFLISYFVALLCFSPLLSVCAESEWLCVCLPLTQSSRHGACPSAAFIQNPR